MNILKFMLMARSKPVLAVGIIVSLISSLSSAFAQIDRLVNTFEPISIVSLLPNLPPSTETPPARNGTGTRGGCKYKEGNLLLTRMVGGKNFQLTVSEHPTFWVYVPYTPQEVSSGEFSIQYEEHDVYRTTFELPATPGIVSVTIPPTQDPLEMGKTYRWYFEINCPPAEQPEQLTTQPAPASLTGFVRRVPQSSQLEAELSRAKNPLERVAAYAKHDIWYEMLTEFAQLRLQYPEDPILESIWLELLGDKRIGLKQIEQELISGSVITSSPLE